MNSLKPAIQGYIQQLDPCAISLNRRAQLQHVADYIRQKRHAGNKVFLNFICVHNSRRSQLYQLWFTVLTYYVGENDIYSVSSGSEVTRVHPNILQTLTDIGFSIFTKADSEDNPQINIEFSTAEKPMQLYSKLFEDLDLTPFNYAAILNCMEAEVKCPVIPDPEIKVLLPLQDPGKFDGTDSEKEAYYITSRQIATEVLWVLKNLDV